MIQEGDWSRITRERSVRHGVYDLLGVRRNYVDIMEVQISGQKGRT